MRLLRMIAAAVIALAMAATPALAAKELLVVVNKRGDSVSLVDPANNQTLAEIDTGFEPHEVYTSPDGRYAYVSDYGTGPRPGNTVTVIDLVAREAVATWDLGNNLRPHGIWVSRDGSRVWVTTEGSKTVVELDAATGDILKVWNTDQEVSHMIVPTPDDAKLYVANIMSGSVTVIERATDTVTTIPTARGAEGIDVSPDGREVWVTNTAANSISIIDVATDEVVVTFNSGGEIPIRAKFTPDGRHVYVSNARTASVSVYDAATREEIASIETGAVPVGILITPDGSRAYVANTMADKITILDTAAHEIIGEFMAGPQPDGMAWAVVPD